MSPLRTLHVCWEYPPRGSGIGNYIYEMTASLRSRGNFTVVVTSRGDGLPEEQHLENGIIYRVYDYEEIGSRRVASLVLDLARRHQVDLIESPDHLGEAAALLPAIKRPPVMINCRYNDVLLRARFAQAHYPWQKLTIALACLRQWRTIKRERCSIENADMLAAPCHLMLDGLRRQGVKLPIRTAVLPKPIAPVEFWENREAGRPTLLFVGRVDIGKGIEYLPGLVKELVARYPDLLLEIAGNDSYARLIGSTQAWVKKRLVAVRSNVHFLGFLNRQELDEAYRRAWVVIVPSKWDTSPTSVLEGMVRRKAIVASPHGGMPEYLAGTDCAIADPATSAFAKAVGNFIESESVRCKAGESGEAKVLVDYSPETCSARYLHFIRGSLANDRRPTLQSQCAC